MTHYLRLVTYTGPIAAVPYYPGSLLTSLSLTNDDANANPAIFLTSYMPAHPEPVSVQSSGAPVQSGGEQRITTYRNVTERCQVHVKGHVAVGVDPFDLVRGVAARINRLLRAAEDWQRDQIGGPVYIEWCPNYALYKTGGSGPATHIARSEILSGQAVVAGTFVQYDWANYEGDITITWTRRYFWEDTAEVQIVTNSVLTNAPSGNSLNINQLTPGAEWHGDLPSPLHLTAVADPFDWSINTVHCGVMWYGNTSAASFWEAEDAGYSLHGFGVIHSSAIGVSNTGSSGNNALRCEMANDQMRFALSSSYRGAYRVLVRVLKFSAGDWTQYPDFGIYARVLTGSSITDPNATVLSYGNTVYPANVPGAVELLDLGFITLPPDPILAASANLYFSVIWGDPGNSDTFDIDYVLLIPSDSYTRWRIAGAELGGGDTLLEYDKAMFQIVAGSGLVVQSVSREGSAVIVKPHQDEPDDAGGITYAYPYTRHSTRLVFAWETIHGAEIHNVGSTSYSHLNINAWYRPRWIHLPERL